MSFSSARSGMQAQRDRQAAAERLDQASVLCGLPDPASRCGTCHRLPPAHFSGGRAGSARRGRGPLRRYSLRRRDHITGTSGWTDNPFGQVTEDEEFSSTKTEPRRARPRACGDRR